MSASEMAFRWSADDGPTLNDLECWLDSFVIFQGIWTRIVDKPYIFVIFQGGPDPRPPPLDPHMLLHLQTSPYDLFIYTKFKKGTYLAKC